MSTSPHLPAKNSFGHEYMYTITHAHLTSALTANLTTVESRKRGVTRMWNNARAAKASEGLGPVLLMQ